MKRDSAKGEKLWKGGNPSAPNVSDHGSRARRKTEGRNAEGIRQTRKQKNGRGAVQWEKRGLRLLEQGREQKEVHEAGVGQRGA